MLLPKVHHTWQRADAPGTAPTNVIRTPFFAARACGLRTMSAPATSSSQLKQRNRLEKPRHLLTDVAVLKSPKSADAGES